jgi:predicted metal-dependent enzyme (double-stranded beta helix superfamily)
MSCNSNETPNISKLPQQQKLKYLLCRAIKYGTAKDVQRFRWFKGTIQDDDPVTEQKKLLHLEVTNTINISTHIKLQFRNFGSHRIKKIITKFIR